jgi:hypothetical protein
MASPPADSRLEPWTHPPEVVGVNTHQTFLRGLVSLSLGFVLVNGAAAAADSVSVKTNVRYNGWTDAVVLSNGRVEAVIVPSVGRWMQFRRAGQQTGPFWENANLAGKAMMAKPWEASHGSFGGDKTWPAPQNAWNWPPPDVFDAAQLAFRVTQDSAVVLTSSVSARFGIKTERRFSLRPGSDSVEVVTTYEKVQGPPVEVGVWVITQTKDPVAAFLPIPKDSSFPGGVSHEWGIPTNHMTVRKDWIELRRDTAASHKIGNDAGHIVWVGKDWVLGIETDRDAAAPHADGGCSTEIYTNPDPTPYVELETLGRLKTLSQGERLSATNRYTLLPRRSKDPVEEARRVVSGGR